MAKGTKKKKKELTIEEKLEQALVPKEEWPYEVPENWCWTKLGNITTVVGGGTPSSKVQEYYKDGDIPWITPADLSGYDSLYISNGSRNITQLGLEKSSAKLLPKGTVCLSSRAPIGYTVIAENEISTNQGFKSFIPSPVYLPEYLLWYLKGNKKLLESRASGTTFLELSAKKATLIEFPLAPLGEQKRIVNRIESLFAKLDEAKEKAQVVVDGFENRRTMILHKAFIGELTMNWRRTHNVCEDSWELLTLNDIAEYKKGPFGSSITKAMFVPKGENTYKVYEQGNAIRKTLDYGHYYIDEEKYNELKGFAVQSGDIIISCAGTIGEVYKLPKKSEAGVINQALMRVRLYPNTEERFFRYYFGEVIKGDVIDQANGTAIKNIPPFKVLKAMEIRLPSLVEQEAIVDLLDEILRKEEQAQETAEHVVEQIDIIKKSILARAFRGELGTNDSADENAEELLKRIL